MIAELLSVVACSQEHPAVLYALVFCALLHLAAPPTSGSAASCYLAIAVLALARGPLVGVAAGLLGVGRYVIAVIQSSQAPASVPGALRTAFAV